MLDTTQMITTTAADGWSIRYGNSLTAYQADTLFPPLYCEKETVKLYQSAGNNLRATALDDESDSKSEAAAVSNGYFSTTKTLTLKKHKADVDPNDEVQVDKPVSDLETEARMTIMDQLLIKKEQRAVTKATAAGNYPTDLKTTLAASATWDVTGGDPRNISKTARLAVRARTGIKANALWLSTKGLEVLSLNEALRDQTKYTSGQSIPIDVLKNLLGVQYIFECAAVQNTNMEGNATQTLSELWGNYAVFGLYDPAPRLKKVCYGVQPIFKQMYSYSDIDTKRGGPAGRVRFIEMGFSYSLEAGAVVSSSDTSFTAGYLVSNIYT